jgi:phosphoribosyl 1,2-cyclic phosphodiesterase
MHASLLVSHRRARVMIDCGADWLHKFPAVGPAAIVLTHAHPDHAAGLKHGAPCPVYATEETWERIKTYPIRARNVVRHRTAALICGITFDAFPVEHSLRAPAVGYRITAGQATIFYVPDLVSIRERHAALHGIDLYIGDGAAIARPIVRRRGDALIGHTSIREQLLWCRSEGVRRAIITHCGSEIVTAEEQAAAEKVRALGLEHGLRAQIAYDGMEITLRPAIRRSGGRLQPGRRCTE